MIQSQYHLTGACRRNSKAGNFHTPYKKSLHANSFVHSRGAVSPTAGSHNSGQQQQLFENKYPSHHQQQHGRYPAVFVAGRRRPQPMHLMASSSRDSPSSLSSTEQATAFEDVDPKPSETLTSSTMRPELSQQQHHVPKTHYGSMTVMQVLAAIGYRSLLLFLIGGGALSWLLSAWAKGSDLQLHDPYSFTVTFPQAPSLEPGVRLRLKGVQVGTVREARSGLESVEAVVEVNQKLTRIPLGSSLVYNKAGPLSPVPYIDVMLPLSPPSGLQMNSVPDHEGEPAITGGKGNVEMALSIAAAAEAAVAGPGEVDACHREGLLLCAGDHVQGVQGGGMDELTALMLMSMKRGVEDPSMLPPVMRQQFEAHLRRA